MHGYLVIAQTNRGSYQIIGTNYAEEARRIVNEKLATGKYHDVLALDTNDRIRFNRSTNEGVSA